MFPQTNEQFQYRYLACFKGYNILTNIWYCKYKTVLNYISQLFWTGVLDLNLNQLDSLSHAAQINHWQVFWIPLVVFGVKSLQWRHNGHDSVSNHQPHDCLLNRVQTQIKENIQAPRHWHLCLEFTGGRWIPRTDGQQRGRCFHLMTSLCVAEVCCQGSKFGAISLFIPVMA